MIRNARRVLLPVAIALLVGACGGASADTGASAEADRLATSQAPAASGTISATVDGRTVTWYVVAGTSQGRRYASGAWLTAGDDRAVSIGGFDTTTPPLDSFGWEGNMPSSFGDYTGSLIQILIPVRTGAPYRIAFPLEDAAALTSVMYMPKAMLDPAGMWQMVEGTLEVASVTVDGGLASAEGTFTGALERFGGGERLTVREGRFRVRSLPDATSLGR